MGATIDLHILTDEASGSLLYHLHAEGAWHVGLVAVALNGNVLGAIERFVGAAAVVPLAILVR